MSSIGLVVALKGELAELQRRSREALAVAQGMECSCTYGDSGWTCEACQIQDLLGVPEVTG